MRFSDCLFWVFHFVWYHFSIYSQIGFVIYKTFTDVKWRKGTGKKPNQTCLFLSKNGTFPGSTEISACFLKSSDATNRHKGLFHKYQERDLAIQAGNLDMSVCQKPNLNPTSFVINGFYIVVPDSWLKFWNGNCEVPVFVCVYMCYRCVVLPQLICKKGVFNWLKGN